VDGLPSGAALVGNTVQGVIVMRRALLTPGAWRSSALTAVWLLGLLLLTACGGPGSEPTSHPEPEPAPSTATVEVEVFFVNDTLGDPCGEVFPVTRTVAADDPVTGALHALLAGPAATEQAEGYGGWFSSDTADALLDAHLDDGTVHVTFADLRQVIPNASSSCGSAGLLAQLDRTLTALDGVTATRYALADQTAFSTWLQLDDPDAPVPEPQEPQPEEPKDATEPRANEPTDGTAASPLTLQRIGGEITAQLAAPYEPTVEVQLRCDRSRPIEAGSVFVCDASSEQLPETDWGAIVVAVLDADTIAWSPGTDNPGSTQQLLRAYAESPHGLLCRDLLQPGTIGHPFDGSGTVPVTAFFWSVVYWNLEGQPARMDVDGDGIPCETLYSAEVVASVIHELAP
jgi:hypothetical protein